MPSLLETDCVRSHIARSNYHHQSKHNFHRDKERMLYMNLAFPVGRLRLEKETTQSSTCVQSG